jgi:DnaJ-class molecular chaperone
MTEPSPFNLIFEPEKYGYTICTHCNGYGSSLKEEADRCTKCEGLGLMPNKERKDE